MLTWFHMYVFSLLLLLLIFYHLRFRFLFLLFVYVCGEHAMEFICSIPVKEAHKIALFF